MYFCCTDENTNKPRWVCPTGSSTDLSSYPVVVENYQDIFMAPTHFNYDSVVSKEPRSCTDVYMLIFIVFCRSFDSHWNMLELINESTVALHHLTSH